MDSIENKISTAAENQFCSWHTIYISYFSPVLEGNIYHYNIAVFQYISMNALPHLYILLLILVIFFNSWYF